MTNPTDTKNQDAAELIASAILSKIRRIDIPADTQDLQYGRELRMIAEGYRAGQASKEPEIAELNESRKRLVQNEFEALKKRDALRAANEILSAENKKFIKFADFINDDSELEEVKSQLTVERERSKKLVEALVWCDEMLTARDQMNCKVHCAPVRLSPITERVKMALAGYVESEARSSPAENNEKRGEG